MFTPLLIYSSWSERISCTSYELQIWDVAWCNLYAEHFKKPCGHKVHPITSHPSHHPLPQTTVHLDVFSPLQHKLIPNIHHQFSLNFIQSHEFPCCAPPVFFCCVIRHKVSLPTSWGQKPLERYELECRAGCKRMKLVAARPSPTASSGAAQYKCLTAAVSRRRQ